MHADDALEPLASLVSLRALSLAGNVQLGWEDGGARLASVLVALPGLQCLELSGCTGVGDVVLEALTYRNRVEAAAAAQGGATPEGTTQQWHW